MAEDKPFLAIDLGAGSGRAFLGFLESKKLRIEEIHRFRNNPVLLGTTLYWDFLLIWENILLSLKKCALKGTTELAGIGVNSWNCDFGLIDSGGTLLINPISYRDPGSEETTETIGANIGDFDLYQRTGIGINSISGWSRLLEFRQRGLDKLLEAADTYLPIPDLVRFFLSGVRNGEQTILWGSQMIDLHTQDWSGPLLDIASVDKRILPEIVKPGTVTGELSPDLVRHTGILKAPVIAVAEHDTISAAISVYETDGKSIILSAGTWFVLGQLVKEPFATQRAFELKLFNETAFNSFFFAKNLMGFYVLENLIDFWKLEGMDCSYTSIIEDAKKAPEFKLSIDVNNPMFFSSRNMPESIRAYLKMDGQPVNADRGSIARAVLESLALSVKKGVADLLEVLIKQPDYLVIIGGGTKNRFLCGMIADAAGLEVVVGPSEAAVIGNIGMQGIAAGQVDSIKEFQSILPGSFQYERIKPKNTDVWRKL